MPRCDAARLLAGRTLSSGLDIDVSLGGWTRRASEAWQQQWVGDRRDAAHRDWNLIHRRYANEPDRLDLSMWVGDRLCDLALITLSGQAASVRFLEGQPSLDCPLRGYRPLVALECAQNYAQGNGKTELRVQPVSREIEDLYRDIFGFELATPKGQEARYRREIS